MRYTLRRLVTGVRDFIEISEDEFTALKLTQQKLLDVLNIEATFDLLLENYAEFEQDLLRLGFRFSLFGEHGKPLGPHREMNRRMVNFLSSARLYLDQVPQDLHAIDGKSSKQTDIFREWTTKQYDSCFAYRLLEALRNYSQHCGFPIHAMILNFKREDTNAGSLMRAGLQLLVEIQNLKKDRKFKKEVLVELEPKADRHGYVNLTLFVREYMEKLCEIHEAMRGEVATEVVSWDQVIITALDRARNAFGGGFSGLSVVREAEDHEGNFLAVDSADIYIAPIDWRKQLETKNRDFGNLSDRYVTGQVGHPG